MVKSEEIAGYFQNGLPYNRFGLGPHNLVVFHGLEFEHKPLTGLSASSSLGLYRFLGKDFTVYVVNRKPSLPEGYSLGDMSDDYAVMIQHEFGNPVDVIGTSTGGSIAQHFAADHPNLVRKLIIHSSAHTLGDTAREGQMSLGRLARQRQWREAYTLVLDFLIPNHRGKKTMVWFGALLMSFNPPKDPSDLVVTIEAEDKHYFKDRLNQILAPTLVVGGAKDPAYTATLFHETAEGIPNSRLILYEEMGHPASGRQFERDVLMFLKEGMVQDI